MIRPWRLTRQAEASLVEIALWTLETFGSRQSSAYEDDLIEKCRDIAAGRVVTQGCRQLVDPDLAEDLRFARSGQVIIVDFLHSRSDLPGKLAELTSRGT